MVKTKKIHTSRKFLSSHLKFKGILNLNKPRSTVVKHRRLNEFCLLPSSFDIHKEKPSFPSNQNCSLLWFLRHPNFVQSKAKKPQKVQLESTNTYNAFRPYHPAIPLMDNISKNRKQLLKDIFVYPHTQQHYSQQPEGRRKQTKCPSTNKYMEYDSVLKRIF